MQCRIFFVYPVDDHRRQLTRGKTALPCLAGLQLGLDFENSGCTNFTIQTGMNSEMDSTLGRFFIILFLFILVIEVVLENICAKESELKSVVEYNIKIFLLRKSCALQ